MSQLAKLKKLIKKRGWVFVAYHLNYRDTNAIKKWIERKRIPGIAQHRVTSLLTQEEL